MDSVEPRLRYHAVVISLWLILVQKWHSWREVMRWESPVAGAEGRNYFSRCASNQTLHNDRINVLASFTSTLSPGTPSVP